MSTPTFTVKAGDTARSLNFDLAIGGTPIDLTYATASLIIRKHKADPLTRTVTVSGAPSSGSVSYDLVATDTDTVGLAYLEFVINYDDNTILRIPTSGYLTMEIVQNLTAPYGAAWP